jgi:alpha-L-fucosidase
MQIMNVELVGSSARIEWCQTEDALEVKLPAVAPCKYAYSFKISLAKAPR